MYVLDETLLILALGVDRGLSQILSLLAARGKDSAGNCGSEGCDRKL